MFEPGDLRDPQLDAVARQTPPPRGDDPCAVAAEDDRSAPGLQRQRQLHAAETFAEHDEPLVATLPPVAVRAVEERAPVALARPRQVRQVVDDAGGNQQKAGPLGSAVREADVEARIQPLDAGHADFPALDLVTGQLLSAE